MENKENAEKETFLNRFFRKFIYIIIIILMAAFWYNNTRNLNAKFDNYENTIKALNDSIHVKLENGFATYSKAAPEIDLKTLVESEYFKTLAEDQKKFYTELNKVKGLIAASKAELQKHGEMIASMTATSVGGVVQGDSVSFKKGTEIPLAETDTTKKMQWTGKVLIGDSVKFKMDYDYKFSILNTFERQPDKSIVVKWKLDDPDLKVNAMQNFIIPQEQKKTKFGRWLEKNKMPLRIVGGSLLFVGGVYTGVQIAK